MNWLLGSSGKISLGRTASLGAPDMILGGRVGKGGPLFMNCLLGSTGSNEPLMGKQN
jgi:hypothetical protein